jgi:hypothetical protein
MVKSVVLPDQRQREGTLHTMFGTVKYWRAYYMRAVIGGIIRWMSAWAYARIR